VVSGQGGAEQEAGFKVSGHVTSHDITWSHDMWFVRAFICTLQRFSLDLQH